MGSDGHPAYDRLLECRRAIALARHFREAEGLSVAQIADRLGRSPATIKAYFYDPTGEKARAVKARYVGVCRGCGAYTQPRNGKGDAYAYCKACHPGPRDGGRAMRRRQACHRRRRRRWAATRSRCLNPGINR
jgi:AraC-like DNA-binding protein